MKNSKTQDGSHFWQDKIFFFGKLGWLLCRHFGSKISSKLLYLARFSRYKHFCVLQFLQNIRKFQMAAIFDETFFFENWDGYSAEIPCLSKIMSKLLYLARVSRYKHFCVLQKIRKFKMAAISGKTKFF